MNRNRKYELVKDLFGAVWYPVQNNLVDHQLPSQSIMCVGCNLVASRFGLRAAIWVKSPTSRIIINLGPKTRPQRVIGRRSPITLKGLLFVRLLLLFWGSRKCRKSGLGMPSFCCPTFDRRCATVACMICMHCTGYSTCSTAAASSATVHAHMHPAGNVWCADLCEA